VVDHLFVNTTRREHVQVTFDISFPVIPCNLLSLDAYDESGAPQDVVQHVYKHKINPDGSRIPGQRISNEPGKTVRSAQELAEFHKSLGLNLSSIEGNLVTT